MKWMRFSHQGRSGFGLLRGDTVEVHHGDMFGDPRPTGERLALVSIEWRTPCEPSQVFALWNNFRAAAEKNGWATPAEPLYFMKPASCLAAHGATIPLAPPEIGRVAYEGELAVVIGQRCRRVPPADAPAHIFGYTCANDVTAIELLNRDASFVQWTRAKGQPGFGPFGPVIETSIDFATARLRTLVAGRERQNYALADMFFSPAELVSRLSHDLTLEPGDVILCGTSLGVLPMKPGSRVEVAIDGIGVLRNDYGHTPHD